MKHERKLRGIVAVRAEGGDVKSLLSDLNSDWQSFKQQHRAEIEDVRAAADDANAKLAAMQINGTGGTGTGTRLSPSAAGEFTDFLKAGQMGDSLKPRADMQGGSSQDGGASVPKQISSVILDQMADLSPMRQLATVERATTSDYSKIVGLRGMSSGWAAETDPRTVTDTPKMGEVAPTQGELFVYAEATQWLLDDSQFNLERWLAENIAVEFAVKEGAAFFSGDGSNKPTGLLTAPQAATDDDTRAFGTLQTVEAANAASIEADDLVNLMTAVRTPYRARLAECAWVMNRSTASAIRSLKDSTGRYLWNDGLAAGQPPTLLGFPVMEAEDMPGIGAENVSIAFGNWRAGYLIVDRTQRSVYSPRMGAVLHPPQSRRQGAGLERH
jgi:HK97 family phage major capsid protein